MVKNARPQRPNINNIPTNRPSVPQPSMPITPPAPPVIPKHPRIPQQPTVQQQQQPTMPPTGLGVPVVTPQQQGYYPQQQVPPQTQQSFYNQQPLPQNSYYQQEGYNPPTYYEINPKIEYRQHDPLLDTTVTNKGKTKKRKPYDGERKNLLWTRLAIWSLIVFVAGLGVYSLIPKSSNLTTSDKAAILANIKSTTGITAFPDELGQATVLEFSKIYFNYSPSDTKTRASELAQYMSDTLLKEYDISGETSVSVTGGPYITDSTMLSDADAIYTVLLQLNNKAWYSYSIPVYYDSEANSIAISGSPTFVNSSTTAEVPADQNTITWEEDEDLTNSMRDSIESYLTSWAASDETNISRYLTKSSDSTITATETAQAGLNNTVSFGGVNSFSVQAKDEPEGDVSSSNSYYYRYASVTVEWIDSATGASFTQQYLLLMQYMNNDWFVYDIQNMATSVERE